MSRSGPDLALLLLAGFRALIDETRLSLEAQGHPDNRSVHHFALRAVDGGATTVTELGIRLDVSRQAAAKTVAVLEQRGYLERTADVSDGRRRPLAVTQRGRDLLNQGEMIMNKLREQWAQQIGTAQLNGIEEGLAHIVGVTGGDDTAGWMVRDLGASA